AEGDDLVGVDALAGLEPEELGDRRLDAGHAGHAADEDHVLDVRARQLGLLEGALADLDRALDEVARELLEALAGEDRLQVEGLVAAARDDERQVDLGLADPRELAL